MLDLTELVHLPPSERAVAVARRFPDAFGAAACGDGSSVLPDWARGGRAAALGRLAAIDPERYARTRNHVDGAVTRLSPWLRHGVLSLAEVRDAALARVRRPDAAAKLISELGWRDYWRQVHAALGPRIRGSIERPAQDRRGPPPLDHVPEDVLAARTGMPCMDAFVRTLTGTGWLHNHERMWLASWLVHTRGVGWRAGADWFLTHLIDGDPASNHLSWQWVAGTFSAKPYLFDRENLETFTGAVHCGPCPIRGACPVEGPVEALAARWFGPGGPQPRPPLRIRPAEPWQLAGAGRRPLVWLSLDSVCGTSPAAAAHPDAPRVFALDPDWLAAERPAVGRLVFLFDCLAEVPGVVVLLGDPRQTLPRHAASLGCDGLALAETPCPRTRSAAEDIHAAAADGRLPVTTVAWPRFCDRSRVGDLGRFSRYWQQVGQSAMRPTCTTTA